MSLKKSCDGQTQYLVVVTEEDMEAFASFLLQLTVKILFSYPNVKCVYLLCSASFYCTLWEMLKIIPVE